VPRVTYTPRHIYFRVRASACPPAYLCVSRKVQRAGGWGCGRRTERRSESTEHGVSYLRAYWRVIQAVHPPLSPPRPFLLPPYCALSRMSRRVTLYLPCTFAAKYISVDHALRSCVRACVRFGRNARTHEKSHFAYSRPLKAGKRDKAIPIFGIVRVL